MAEIVREHLADLPFKAHVVADGIRHEGEWWSVPVYADEDQAPTRRWRYYEMLAGVEVEIEEEHGVKLMLVPVTAPEPVERPA